MDKPAYLAGVLQAVKEATGALCVRPPDLDKTEAPASESRTEQADQGRTTPAPDAAPDVKADDSAQAHTVEKQSEWDELEQGERQYVTGIVKACQDHGVNPVTLLPITLVKPASAELKARG
jgi:hypothetical protein